MNSELSKLQGTCRKEDDDSSFAQVNLFVKYSIKFTGLLFFSEASHIFSMYCESSGKGFI